MLHARFVTEDRAPRNAGRGVHSQHGHAVPLTDQVQAQGFNEGAFANAWHAADAQAERSACLGQQLREQSVGLLAMIRARGLQQCDGLGHAATLHRRATVHDGVKQRGGSQRAHGHALGLDQAAPKALRICSSTSLALAGMGVPGP